MMARRSLLLMTLLALASCASPPPPPPSLDLTIIAGADQNPDADGKSAPVAIRLYQLASGLGFANADVFALTDRPAATLGQDNLGSEEIIVAPGEHRTIGEKLKDGAQVLGIAVLFRDIDHATWHAQAPLAAHGPTNLVLKTSRLTITLEPKT